jgi:hypothetical protein
MSTPTPETDEASKIRWRRRDGTLMEAQGDSVDADFARKLERERDEAREQTAAVVRVMDKVVKERDEARAEVERLKADKGRAEL